MTEEPEKLLVLSFALFENFCNYAPDATLVINLLLRTYSLSFAMVTFCSVVNSLPIICYKDTKLFENVCKLNLKLNKYCINNFALCNKNCTFAVAKI